MTESHPAGDRSRDALLYAISIAGPIALYLVLHVGFGLSDGWSLTGGAVAAAAATVVTTIRRGRPNGVVVLVLLELAVSIGLIAVTNDPRVLLFKPAVLVGILACYLLFTCIWGRPAAYRTLITAARRRDPARAGTYERAWDTSTEFRMRLRIMTAAWGIALLLDALVRVYFAVTTSVTEALIAPHVIDPVLILAGLAVAVIQFRSIKRIVTD